MSTTVPAQPSITNTPDISDRRMPWKRFLLFWLGGTCALLSLVAALNIAVDPFFVFGTPLINGFNKYKPATQGREALAKAALVMDAQPRTLLVGASKVQVGLDPESTIWNATERPVFNAGIPGGLSPATLRVLTDVLKIAPVHRVLVLLEFVDMLEPPGINNSDTPFRTTGWARAREFVDAALTRDALEASVRTLSDQWTDIPSGLRPNGQMYDGVFRGPTESEGPGAVFGQKMTFNAERVAGMRARLSVKPGVAIAQLDVVRKLIATCRERGIALDLALPPVHADFLRLLDLAGLWPRYLAMRTVLADTVAQEGGGQVHLWNFMGFDSYSTEPVPPLGKRASALRWFWEPNHFRPELGQMMLETIYRGRKGVGNLLTPEDVAADNQRQTEALNRDKAAQPAEWARANSALIAARSR